MSLLGCEILNFTLARRLGRREIGGVYLGEHSVLGTRSVFKVFPSRLVQRATVAERVAREVRLLQDLEHPTIAEVINAGWLEDGPYFFQLELVAGVDLRTYLATKGPLPGPQLVDVFEPLVEALALAHARGLTHRSLHPGNIMLAERRGSVRLLDLGVAKRLDIADRSQLARLPFVAPELIHDPGACDPRVDVYGLGATLFAATSGMQPGASRESPAPRPEIPRALARVLARCLAPEPEGRWPTIEAAWSEVRQAVSPARSRSSARRSRPAAPAAPRALLVSAFVFAALLGLAVAWLLA